MSTEKFEKYAQANLNDYSTAIDAEALWNAIEPAVRPQKRSRFFWFWILSGLLTGAAAIYFVAPVSESQPIGEGSKIILPVEVEQEETGQANTIADTDAALDPSPSAQLNKINEQSEKTVEQSNVSQSTRSTKSKALNNSSQSAKIIPISPAVATNTEATNISSTKPTHIVSLSENQVLTDNELPTDTKPAAINDQSIAEDEMTKLKETKNTEQAINSASTATEETTDINESTAKAVETVEAAVQMENNPVEPIAEEEEEEKAEDNIDLALEETSPAPPRFWRNHSLGFGLRAGIGNSITTLTADDEIGRAIRVLREDSETKLESLDFGLELLLKSNDNGYYFSTGVDYQRSTRRFDYDEFLSTVDSVEGITMIIMNPINNTSDTIYGNIARTTTESTLKQIYNNIHFVNIPIAAGYSLNYERWSFGVEAGALINIITKHKGQIRDSAESFYDLKTDDNKWLADNVGVSFKAAIQIGFSPTENFQIIAGPNFRSPVKVSQAANPVQQEQTTLGFQVAARYWLDY